MIFYSENIKSKFKKMKHSIIFVKLCPRVILSVNYLITLFSGLKITIMILSIRSRNYAAPRPQYNPLRPALRGSGIGHFPAYKHRFTSCDIATYRRWTLEGGTEDTEAGGDAQLHAGSSPATE